MSHGLEIISFINLRFITILVGIMFNSIIENAKTDGNIFNAFFFVPCHFVSHATLLIQYTYAVAPWTNNRTDWTLNGISCLRVCHIDKEKD